MIDITERFLGCELGQAKDTDCLILRKLAFPCEVFDKGKQVKCSHQLEYRWLSCKIEDFSDAEVCVLGNDYMYVTNKEYKELKKKLESGQTLFDCFNLF